MQPTAILFAILSVIGAVFSTRIISVQPVSATPAVERVTMIFLGDMMFDRHIRKMMRVHGTDHVFSCIAPALADADLVIGNLEGPITDAPSMSEGSIVGTPENFTFTFPPETAGLLARHNIGLVNLGNNHILNQGAWGVRETRRHLDQAGVRYFGHPDVTESERLARVEMRRSHYSFISYSEWTSTSVEAVADLIADEHASGKTVIVYAHWGDEYVPAPERVKRTAHHFVESGASLIIGTHPHVIQEREDYRGVPIYYSLGNTVFDQYWEPSVREGLIIEAVFAEGRVESVRESRTELQRDGRVCLKE